VARLIATVADKLAKALRQRLAPRLLSMANEELELLRRVQLLEDWELPTEEQYKALLEQIEDVAPQEAAQTKTTTATTLFAALPSLPRRSAQRGRQYLSMCYVALMWGKWVARDFVMPPGFVVPHEACNTMLRGNMFWSMEYNSCATIYGTAHTDYPRMYQFVNVPNLVHSVLVLYSGKGRGIIQNWREKDGDLAIGTRIVGFLAEPKFSWTQEAIDKARLGPPMRSYDTAYVLPQPSERAVVNFVEGLRALAVPPDVTPHARAAGELAFFRGLSVAAECAVAYNMWMRRHPDVGGTQDDLARDWVRLWNEVA
jgi:hypothetical protein